MTAVTRMSMIARPPFNIVGEEAEAKAPERDALRNRRWRHASTQPNATRNKDERGRTGGRCQLERFNAVLQARTVDPGQASPIVAVSHV